MFVPPASAQAPIEVGVLWHMHQPIYYPYESILQTQANNRYSFSVVDVHNSRFGPYNAWPRDAIQLGLGLPNLGAQVSFTGSLIENLNVLKNAGVNGGLWNNWDAPYDQARQWTTSLGNPRLDLVAFGYHHPLMPLLDEQDIRMQIKLHKHVYAQAWAGATPYSKGIFPAENAFSERIIPALVAEGIEWALVDNIHFDRACIGYPHTDASNLYAPNKADQINPDPATTGGAWVQLNNLWAPSRVSAPFGYQPAHVQHVNPNTGAITKMIAVPAARYEGNEDGRGGYGAFLYATVMDQYRQYNTNPKRPMYVVLHHDGDNFGGGSEGYYHSNFQNMVNWDASTSNYNVSTTQDYLERFPVPQDALIHVEPGSWAGADNGDPEFKKWLGDPNAQGWSPDRNSWAVMTAAKNRVFHADWFQPATNMQNVMTGSGTSSEQAWHYLLCGQASDYWYWDGTEIWDSNVTRACNQAVAHADAVINTNGPVDPIGPTIFLPQRNPYNPGGLEFGQQQPSDFEVWTYIYDVHNVFNAVLKWRIDADGANPLASTQNETYAGGAEVGAWNSNAMSSSDVAPPAGILTPTYRALKYSATITGQTNVLIDYYVECNDGRGNISRSDIQHVWVGQNAPPPSQAVVITPNPAQAGQNVAIEYNPAGGPLSGAAQVHIHYGFNNWASVISPDPVMTWNTTTQRWTINIPVSSTATQLDIVFNNNSGTWDNNAGADWHFTVENSVPPPGFVMDGVRDASSIELASNAAGTMKLWADLQGDVLYVATNDAGEGNDHFLFLADVPGPLGNAPWAKAGQVAGWDAFIADENSNDYEGWFDAVGTREAMTGANGGVLEGTINLREEFGGTMPSVVYLAAAAYGNNDGNALVPTMQAPAFVANNGNIEGNEYYLLDLSIFNPPPDCEGDTNGDNQINGADLSVLLSTFGQNVTAGTGADFNGDGAVNGADLSVLLGRFGTAC